MASTSLLRQFPRGARGVLPLAKFLIVGMAASASAVTAAGAGAECPPQFHHVAINTLGPNGSVSQNMASTLTGARNYISSFLGPSLGGTVQGAELQIVTTAIYAPVPVSYDLYLVNGPGYEGMTNGPKVGSILLGPDTASRTITIPLNQAFLDHLNSLATQPPSLTYDVALGAALTSTLRTNAYLQPLHGFLNIVVAPTNAPVFTTEPQDMPLYPTYGNWLWAEAAPCAQYQWRRNGVDIPGATTSGLFVTDVSPPGGYTVVAANSFGSTTSRVARVTLDLVAPSFTGGESNAVEILVGQTFQHCVGVTGSPLPAMQWFRAGVPIPGATGSCLPFNDLRLDQAGTYRLVASNALGVATATLELAVREAAPYLNWDAPDLSVVEGGTLRLPLGVSGGPNPEIYLSINGAKVSLPEFTIFGASTNDAGEYRFIASNYLGSVTSRVARIDVQKAGPLDRWSERNPLPQVNTIMSMAAGNGLLVGVGEAGTILQGTSYSNWTLHNRRTQSDLLSVASGGGRFVAVTEAGNLLTSEDGQNWTHRPGGVASIRAVTYAQNQFFAAGYGGIAASTDGISWARISASDHSWNSIAYGNGVFVAGGGRLYVSSNAVDWVHVQATEWIESISFLNGQFVAVGDEGMIITSADGMRWQTQASGTLRRIYEVAYGHGTYVAVGARGNVLSSMDGVAWTLRNSGTPDRLEAVLFHDGLFIAAGENGTTITSPDGINWTKRNFGTTRDLDGMVVTPDLVVVVGKAGTILTSTNGIDFVQQQSGATNNLHGVSWNTNTFVAVGEPGVILTSPDGRQWTARNSGVTNSLKRAHFAMNLWVAVGTEGTILVSPDAITWNSLPRQRFDDLNDVTFGAGMFVIVGDNFTRPNGTLFRSTDGFNWTNATVGSLGKNLRAITYADGMFVGVANDGGIILSTNAVKWEVHFDNLGQNLRDISWNNGLWTVVGNNGLIGTATNPRFWTKHFSRARENLHGHGVFQGRSLAIGNRGTIIQSDRRPTSRLFIALREGYVDVQGRRSMEGENQLQMSSDLQSWTTVTSFPSAELIFEQSLAQPESKRFFRILER